MSSAGAISKLHHQTKQQFISFNIFSIHFLSKEISINTFTHSHVAAGDVIAFEKFFGNLIPSDAISGTIIIVVSFPETQPIQCLSATIDHFGCFNIEPHSAIAFAVNDISLFVVG
ncbi:hypothetical protein J5751_01255 [bacterium]|nr:hypothetical protein [bacterium]